MSRLAKILLYFFILFLFTQYSNAETKNTNIICNQPYALCNTSPCIPIPGSKDKAICFCSVFDGISVGNTSCALRKRTTDQFSQINLVSSYSFADVKVNRLMTCPAGHRWTFCLDKPCIVDPRNPNQAICRCDIETTESYVTFGGQCDTSTCSNTLYSAANIAEINTGNQALMEALGLSHAPVAICPLSKS
jgi:hypothetical protein